MAAIDFTNALNVVYAYLKMQQASARMADLGSSSKQTEVVKAMLRNVRNQRSHVIPSYQDVNTVKDKLNLEITELQAKMDKVSSSPSQNNLATVQTFKEMIYSRNELLNSLGRQKDERSVFGVDRRIQ